MRDVDEIEAAYDAHSGALYGFLLNITRNEADARDLLQEVFVRLARDPGLLRSARNPRSFLLRISHNLAVDFIRRESVRNRATEELQGEPVELFAKTSSADLEAFREELQAALGQLPAEQRAIIHLKLWEGLTFEEIAGTLNIPPNTAASRYRYGIDKLRGAMRLIHEDVV